MTTIKLPYEPPLIIDLSGGQAFADSPKCKNGASAEQQHCQTGGSPGQKCQSGATAFGGKCQSGSVASDKCQSGSSPQSNKCDAGSVASSECDSGSAAGGKCDSG